MLKVKIYNINNTLLKSKNLKYLIKIQLKSLALYNNKTYGSNILKKHQIYQINEFDKMIQKKVLKNILAQHY